MSAGSSSVGCELRLSGDRWILSGDPYILYRAEKAIPFCEVNKDGARTWPATEEIAVEMLWFCQRFKSIHTKYELVLRSAAAKYNLARIGADKVMRGEYDIGQIQFRDGQAPRDYQAQNAMLWRSVGGLLCADSLGTGKAQPLDCNVLTPSGWEEIGKLNVGDCVVDPDGGVATVKGVYDRGVRPVYRVTSVDGRSTLCCDEHLWTVLIPERGEMVECTLELRSFRRDFRGVQIPLYVPSEAGIDWLNIESVEFDSVVPTVCIAVTSKRNLYVTDDCLVTHNTISGLAGVASPEMLPALIVAPSALCLQWKQQIEFFLPGLSSHIIKQQRNYDLQVVAVCEKCGEAATAQSVATRRCKYCKGNRFKRSHADIYLLSYNLADHWKIEISRVVKSVIYEEAHELRLDSSAKYKACKHIANNAKYRLGLTGSPVMNWGGEMFNIINLLCPGKLGTKSQFQETWCGASEGAGKEPPLREPEAFAQYLKNQHMMTRRTREDVGRYIPEEQQIIHNIDFDESVFSRMTKDAKELARAIVRMSEGELMKSDNLSASRFNQMLYHATGVSKAAHVANFAEMILESGEPIMLFAHHRDCFARGTKALRFDGTTVNVEDVKVGDVLLGPDGTPRNVKSLTRGNGRMYRVIPKKGLPWVCSENHIIAFYDKERRGNKYRQMRASDWEGLTESKKRRIYLYRSELQQFPDAKPVIEPWLLGYWLGNGSATLTELKICSPDHEVETEMQAIAARYPDAFVRKARVANGVNRFAEKIPCYFLTISTGLRGNNGRRKMSRNALLRHFQSLNLNKNKHIPHEYKVASVKDRWELLAGLIDSDGHVFKSPNCAGNMTFANCNKTLCDDVAFVARSLGLGVTVSKSREASADRQAAYVVNIAGDITPLPTRKARKRPTVRHKKASVLRTGFRIEPAGVDDYFGFEVDGDNLFLLDDFTVVHNCFEIYCRMLGRYNPLMFTGSENRNVKEHNKQQFMAGKSNLIICSLMSGVGIDGLQHRCNVGVFGELAWSPGVVRQCIGRYHRDGQKNPCLTYILTSEAGIDPYMLQTLGVKRLQVDGVVQAKATSNVMDSVDTMVHLRELAKKFLAA